MKHVSTTLTSLAALSMLLAGCAPEEKAKTNTQPATNKADVLAHGTPAEEVKHPKLNEPYQGTEHAPA